jgi:hypothetical protein
MWTVGAIGTIARLAWFISSHYAWLAGTVAMIAAGVGEYYSPKITNAVLASMVALAAVKVLAWQMNLSSSAGTTVASELVSAISQSPPPRWRRPYEVLIELDPDLNRKISDAADRLNAYDNEFLAKKKKEPGSQSLSGLEMMSLTLQINEDRKPLKAEYDKLVNWRFTKLRAALEEAQYIAQAYISPRKSGETPVDIPAAEWRLLQFDWNNLEHVFGEGVEYTALRIASV